MEGADVISIICFDFGTVEVEASLVPLVLFIGIPEGISFVVLCCSNEGSEEWCIMF